MNNEKINAQGILKSIVIERFMEVSGQMKSDKVQSIEFEGDNVVVNYKDGQVLLFSVVQK